MSSFHHISMAWQVPLSAAVVSTTVCAFGASVKGSVKLNLNTGSGGVSGMKSDSSSWLSCRSCTAGTPAQSWTPFGTKTVCSPVTGTALTVWKLLRKGEWTAWA
uniref:Putative secreted protein n=1 Tax=Ixodes ricinus TaxID=34613 RepID=A0A6B0UAT2_IXORI